VDLVIWPRTARRVIPIHPIQKEIEMTEKMIPLTKVMEIIEAYNEKVSMGFAVEDFYSQYLSKEILSSDELLTLTTARLKKTMDVIKMVADIKGD
jgi:hypothetical protein